MAGVLKAFSNATLGFLGLNTQESGITLEGGYATKAINCIIDKFGRLGSRRGWEMVTTVPDGLTTSKSIESLFEFVDSNMTSTFLSGGNLKLFTGTTTLVESPIKAADQTTNVSITFTGNRWQFAQLAEGIGFDASIYGFAAQGGNPFLVYRKVNHTGDYIFQKIGDYGSKPTGVSIFDPDCCHSAFGRMWVAGVTGAKSTVYFSKLLDGATFTGAGSGLLDIATIVGDNDEIIGISSHNSFLIIFCRNNIVIYAGAQSPTTMILQDTINGVGCIARDSIQQTGTDLIFLSNGGIRSLNRVIQDKSMPMRDLSTNIRDDLVEYINGEDLKQIKSVYFERDAFYLLVLPNLQQTFYFDVRQTLPNGAARVTSWEGFIPKALCATRNRNLYLGMVGGIGRYFGYTDNGSSYRLTYFTPSVDAGQPFNLKFLKKASLIVIASGSQDIIMKYGFDYKTTYSSRTYTEDFTGGSGEYNLAEYNIGEFTSGTAINDITMHLGGSGKILQFGIEIPIEGSPVSLQQLTVYLKTGKML
ncbi:hypothetical protein UFOVP22_8 [uncultured Caudovirales phage]|uniref:Uncharacterized protein n=1 Tax=uncultured Caudovirales phage TaxID=2100421 RepID=A0A6J5T7R5_9CAUD|nr:hypothetical protein UFOVP22_8 [uncultured Caudovirales phage]